jgi:class 3 adenylate cyclase/YHS domain-containing protein
MGDSAAVEVIDRFSDLVREAVAEFRGQVIKQIGDGFMLAFSDPSSAILGGLAIERSSSSEPQFPAVRSGAHTGMVIYREADYLGATVNTAARVAAAARGHQLLVTEAVRRQAEDLSDVEFSALGRHELKGVPEPVDLFLVQPEEEPRKRVIDPVCGMELDPDRAAAELVWEGQRFWFCSQGCLQRFTKAPERYARSQSTEIGQVERG